MVTFDKFVWILGAAALGFTACSQSDMPSGRGCPKINEHGLPEVQLELSELSEGNSCNPVRYRYYSGVEMVYHEHFEDCYLPASQTYLRLWFSEDSDSNMLNGLSHYPSLKALGISAWNFTNVDALAQLKYLESLRLGTSHPYDHGIENLDSISELTKLKKLDLSFVRTLASVDGLQNLHALEELNLYSTSVTDISALSDLKKIRFLNLEDTHIRSIAPLSGYTTLVSLNISNTEIRDLAAISTMTSLTYLALSQTPFEDLSPLRGAVNLEYVAIDRSYSDGIVDLAALLNLPNLRNVFINPEHAPAEQVARLRLKGVKVGLGIILY